MPTFISRKALHFTEIKRVPEESADRWGIKGVLAELGEVCLTQSNAPKWRSLEARLEA